MFFLLLLFWLVFLLLLVLLLRLLLLLLLMFVFLLGACGWLWARRGLGPRPPHASTSNRKSKSHKSNNGNSTVIRNRQRHSRER